MRLGARAALLAFAAAPAWAGPGMSTPSNSIPRSAFTAGGSSATTAGNGIVFTIAEEVAFSTAATAANKARAGLPPIESFPNPVGSLTPLSDNTVSSATVQWTTPGYDGGRGLLQKGSSYLIQVASYTAPDVFADSWFVSVQVSTSGQPLGGTVGAGVTGLIANTTYFVQVRAVDNDGGLSYPVMSTFTTLATTPTFTAGKVFFAVTTASSTVSSATVAVAWNALPPSPSSASCAGYVLLASSNNFGALAPAGAPIYSSTTYSVLASTLTLGTTFALDLASTYYFQVGSLNWAGQVNYTTATFKLVFSIRQSTGLIHFGAIDPFVARSTVSTSSMVVTNTGNWPVTLGLWASTATPTSSPWSIAASSGVDQVALLGLWNSGSVGPAASAFSTNIDGTIRYSQNAGNYAGTQSGFQLAPGQSATLWLLLWLPTTSSTVGPETVRVTPQAVYP